MQSFFRFLGTVVGLLLLTVLLPRVANFLTSVGLPVNEALGLVERILDWFWQQAMTLFYAVQRALRF